eukprot:TRINITY_DN101088_c0_g1_i1.p1 TRINITY_DN101088_c0_g1~~TRINITY_DN101088_c0_g1_i1.p1  ORF type:complete len:394 (-),score=38.03 TRINITY_DN101088_c0_g1_i1:675-1856(-)
MPLTRRLMHDTRHAAATVEPSGLECCGQVLPDGFDVSIDIVMADVRLRKDEISRTCDENGVVSIEYTVYGAMAEKIYKLHVVQVQDCKTGPKVCIGRCEVDRQSTFLRPRQDLLPLYRGKPEIIPGFQTGYSREEVEGKVVITKRICEFKFAYPEVSRGRGSLSTFSDHHAPEAPVLGLIEVDIHEKEEYEVPFHRRQTGGSFRRDHALVDPWTKQRQAPALTNKSNIPLPSVSVQTPCRPPPSCSSAEETWKTWDKMYAAAWDGDLAAKAGLKLAKDVSEPQSEPDELALTPAPRNGANSSGPLPLALPQEQPDSTDDGASGANRQIATKPGAQHETITSRPVTERTTKPKAGRMLWRIKIHYTSEQQFPAAAGGPHRSVPLGQPSSDRHDD